MQDDTGIIRVIQMDENGHRSTRIDCPTSLIPSPGKYVLADEVDVRDSVLGWPLFSVGLNQSFDESNTRFLGPVPSYWRPGTRLHLLGPLGHGFQIPLNIRRLVLVVFGDTASRLLPLIHPALIADVDVVFFSNAALPPLPAEVEIRPFISLPEALAWADFMAIDMPKEKLPSLREILALEPEAGLPCQAQALITLPMPCAGIGDCGACAVKSRQGYELACKDGPVFDLNILDW